MSNQTKKDFAELRGPVNTFSSLADHERTALLDALKQICGLFWGPNPDQCKDILQGTCFKSFQVLNTLTSREVADDVQRAASLVERFGDSHALCNHLEEDFIRLFVSRKGGIAAPLYQSCYEFENAPLMGVSAEMMTRRLQAQGLSVADHLHEPPDHVSVEIEYLFFLLEKGASDKNDALIEEAVSFVSKDMLPWILEFRNRLIQEPEPSFYAFAASVLCGLLQWIAQSAAQ